MLTIKGAFLVLGVFSLLWGVICLYDAQKISKALFALFVNNEQVPQSEFPIQLKKWAKALFVCGAVLLLLGVIS